MDPINLSIATQRITFCQFHTMNLGVYQFIGLFEHLNAISSSFEMSFELEVFYLIDGSNKRLFVSSQFIYIFVASSKLLNRYNLKYSALDDSDSIFHGSTVKTFPFICRYAFFLMSFDSDRVYQVLLELFRFCLVLLYSA